MDKFLTKFKTEILWGGGFLVLVIIVFVGITSQKTNVPVDEKGVVAGTATGIAPEVNTEQMFNGKPAKDVFTTEVPQNAQLTKTELIVPASADKTLTTSARTIVMKVSQNGFDPASITVNQWDRVELVFSPQDGNYDFSIPYLGTHFFAVKKGEQKTIAFEMPSSGTFTFECLDACPASGKIKGEIVVLPKDIKQ